MTCVISGRGRGFVNGDGYGNGCTNNYSYGDGHGYGRGRGSNYSYGAGNGCGAGDGVGIGYGHGWGTKYGTGYGGGEQDTYITLLLLKDLDPLTSIAYQRRLFK